MSITEQDSRGAAGAAVRRTGATARRPTRPASARRVPGDRTPPQDMAAEQTRARRDAALQGRHRRRRRGAPRRRLLPARATRSIHDAIIDLYGRGEPADPVTVAAELQRRGELQRIGGAPYLHTLSANVPIAANAGYYAEIVREKAILRRLVDAGTKIVQIGYAGEGDVDDVVDQAQAEVYKVTDKRSSRGLRAALATSWTASSTRSRRSATARPGSTACRPASPTSTT